MIPRFVRTLALFAGLTAFSCFAAPVQHYTASWSSLRGHPLPEWFQNAKFGIFIHWGLYSVPGWAPPEGTYGQMDFTEFLKNNPYAEWYLNSLRIVGSPTWKYHQRTYGKDFSYGDFVPIFERESAKWKPDMWADLFKRVGARYVVLTTRHHDSYTLWPSKVHNPHLPDNQQGSKRDLVGELTNAVRAKGLRMGLYYSGGRDWTFTQQPYVVAHHEPKAYLDTDEYARFTDAQMRELIDLYSPSILWDDIGYSSKGKLTEIFSDYYNRIPDGVINDRFTDQWSDFTTPEYASYEKITPKKWEANRGIGHSFGYNRAEGPKEMLSVDELIGSLADIVSKNGNLLLDIGPEADGTVSPLQLERLTGLGDWLAVNGEAIFDTSPWLRAEGHTQSGIPIRFTQKKGIVYAILLQKPAEKAVTVSGLNVDKSTRITILGSETALHWSQAGGAVTVELPDSLPGSHAWVFKLAPNRPPTTAELDKRETHRSSRPE